MEDLLTDPIASPHLVGALLVGGDYATANGDTSTLEHIARQLALCVAEPLRAELATIVAMCRSDADHAGDEWPRVRMMLRSALRQPDLDYAPH
jgi:hypothetical protein